MEASEAGLQFASRLLTPLTLMIEGDDTLVFTLSLSGRRSTPDKHEVWWTGRYLWSADCYLTLSVFHTLPEALKHFKVSLLDRCYFERRQENMLECLLTVITRADAKYNRFIQLQSSGSHKWKSFKGKKWEHEKTQWDEKVLVFSVETACCHRIINDQIHCPIRFFFMFSLKRLPNGAELYVPLFRRCVRRKPDAVCCFRLLSQGGNIAVFLSLHELWDKSKPRPPWEPVWSDLRCTKHPVWITQMGNFPVGHWDPSRRAQFRKATNSFHKERDDGSSRGCETCLYSSGVRMICV